MACLLLTAVLQGFDELLSQYEGLSWTDLRCSVYSYPYIAHCQYKKNIMPGILIDRYEQVPVTQKDRKALYYLLCCGSKLTKASGLGRVGDTRSWALREAWR